MSVEMNMSELMLILHNTLDTDSTQHLYRHLKPKNDYPKVMQELRDTRGRNGIREGYDPITEEEADLVEEYLGEVWDDYTDTHDTNIHRSENSYKIKMDELKYIRDTNDMTYAKVNASGLGDHMYSDWTDLKMERFAETDGYADIDWDRLENAESLLFKIGYL